MVFENPNDVRTKIKSGGYLHPIQNREGKRITGGWVDRCRRERVCNVVLSCFVDDDGDVER